MATYNREHYIVEALKSIKNQSHSNWECLIIDDGGSDNTEAVITPILKQDTRFTFFQRTDTYLKGLPGCRNYGLDIATGEYIVFFDDDDIVHPQNLELCLSVFKKHEDLHFCNYLKQSFVGAFDTNLINEDFNFNCIQTNHQILEDVVTQKTPFASCTVMWKKACFKSIRFNESLMYAEEWECYQRILSTNIKGVLIKKQLYFNRKHANSNTGEYWRKDKTRINSKKKAIHLVVSNLYKKGLLTPYLFKYLMNLAISFRDFKLVKGIIKETKPNIKLRVFYQLKYYLYPVWKKIFKIKKQILN